MKLLGYLRSCLPTIALVVAAVALSAFILAVSGAGLAVIVLVSIISCLGLALALAADWVRKRPFYDDLAASDHPHFIQTDQHAAFAVLVHQRSGPVKGIAVRPSDPSLAGMPAAFG